IVALGDAIRSSLTQVEAQYRWPHQDDADVAPRILISYFNLPITALSASLLALIAMRLGATLKMGMVIGLAFAFSTFAWGQSRIIVVEPLQGLLVLISCSLLLHGTPVRSLLGGCALGFAILVKMTSILALPALLLLPDEQDRFLCRRPI